MRNLLLVLALVCPIDLVAQDIKVRRVVAPSPVNLRELIAVAGPAPSRACAFAAAELNPSTTAEVAMTDTAALKVPVSWQRVRSVEYGSDSAEVRLITADGSRVRIERERNGANGRSFLVYRSGEKPQGDSCTLSYGVVGAIWTFYDPDPDMPNNPLPFMAFADVLTPAGRRYRATSASRTADDRLLTAGALATIFFRQTK